jgi:hypothetical protein
MAGQFRFKNNSGTVVAQISASNAGAMSFSGSALDFSSVTSLTLGTSTLTGTASFATAAVSSSYALNSLTGSNALTASSADTLYVRNNATVLGSITAQTLIVQTVTSSVLFTSGSNIIGSSLSNVQELTGSVGITGSLIVSGAAAFSDTITSATGISVGLTGTNYILWNTQGGIKLGRANIGPEDSLTSRWTGTLAYIDIAYSAQWNGGVTILANGGGSVGIGTLTPTRLLDVSALGTAYIRASDRTNSVNVDMLAASSGGWVGTQSNHSFQLQTNNTERMRILSGGQVGIGTTTIKSLLGSNTKLTVAGSGGTSLGAAGGSIGSAAGSGTGALNLGISIDGLDGGMTLLLLASRNVGAGTNTASAVYIISFYYSDGNFPVITYVGGTNNYVSFGSSGGNLTATNAAGGNNLYSWFANK